MRPRLIVLRPEPGNAATCGRIRAAGGEPVALPLFEVHAIDWAPPDPAGFDALLLTSANAARHAGLALALYSHLPVVAVGTATARAAQAASLRVIATGAGDADDAAALLATHDLIRVLHLAGRDHRPLPFLRHPGPVPGSTAPRSITLAAPAAPWTSEQVWGDEALEHSACQTDERSILIVPVYASEPIAPPILTPLMDATALIHSPRAGDRLAALVDAAGIDRGRIAVAAISANALAAAGPGWRDTAVAPTIGDAPLIDAALSIDRNRCGGDKTA